MNQHPNDGTASRTRAQSLSVRQLIWICLIVIATVFLAASAASIVGRITVGRAVGELSDQIAPLQDKVEQLRRAYVDQETGQRGFLLSGNPITLEPYTSGTATSDRLVPELRTGLAGDAQAGDLLEKAVAAAAAWRSQAAEPQIAARRGGPISPQQIERWALDGLRLFDQLRTQLRSLASSVDELAAHQLQRIHSAQRVANIIQIIAVGVLLVVLITTIVVVQRLLGRPLNTLVGQVKRVADGDYDQPISRAGPREVTELSEAVEEMRENLRASTIQLLEGERRNEQGRIAADVHDRIIQRVFGLGLGLTSASARRNPELQPFIDETDDIIQDLREVIFNLSAAAPPGRRVRLRSEVFAILERSATALGFTPTLQFDGPIDDIRIDPALHAAILAVIWESLSNTARHAQATAATLRIAATSTELRVTVEDNGIGVTDEEPIGGGRRSIRTRASQFGGKADIKTAPSGHGTLVDWAVPLSGRNQPVDPQR